MIVENDCKSSISEKRANDIYLSNIFMFRASTTKFIVAEWNNLVFVTQKDDFFLLVFLNVIENEHLIWYTQVFTLWNHKSISIFMIYAQKEFEKELTQIILMKSDY